MRISTKRQIYLTHLVFTLVFVPQHFGRPRDPNISHGFKINDIW
jgi:hypothetical protein